tara:strand:+ start:798 stop:1034 length:237 start_codon:yes stop_codon:yes gene_type:complete
MSAIKNELINSLTNNQSLEGMKQLTLDDLDLICTLIGTYQGLELAKLKPDMEKLSQVNKLNGTIILMKTELKHTESIQ